MMTCPKSHSLKRVKQHWMEAIWPCTHAPTWKYRWAKASLQVWVHETELILILLFINYCVIFHMNCMLPFAHRCISCSVTSGITCVESGMQAGDPASQYMQAPLSGDCSAGDEGAARFHYQLRWPLRLPWCRKVAIILGSGQILSSYPIGPIKTNNLSKAILRSEITTC